MPKVKTITTGYTVLAAWRKCPTYFKNAYLERLRRAHPLSTFERGSALEFGKALHVGLESYYTAASTQDSAMHAARESAALSAADSSLTNTDSTAPRSIDHVGELMQAYIERYPLAAEPFEVLSCETEHDVMLHQDEKLTIIWRAHIDALVKMKADASTVVLEHKTTSGNPAESLIDRMLPNDQAVGYSFVAQNVLNLPGPVPVLFNGLCSDREALRRFYDPIKRAAYVKRTKKEPFDPFLRHVVNIEQWMIDEWKAAAVKDIKRMVEDIEAASFSRNAPDACTLFNTRCQFTDLCKSAPGNRDALKEFCYDTEDWHGFAVEYE